MDACADKHMLRILMIEDNRFDVLNFRESLESLGVHCQIQSIRDGEEALHYTQRPGPPGDPATPDLIVLDLNLPRRDGMVVLKGIRESVRLRDVPVAILTNSAWPEDQQKTSELGADLYVRKPFDMEDYLKIANEIRSLIEARKGLAATPPPRPLPRPSPRQRSRTRRMG